MENEFSEDEKKKKNRQYTRNMYSNLSKKKKRKRCEYPRGKYRNLSKEEKDKKHEYALNFMCMYKN